MIAPVDSSSLVDEQVAAIEAETGVKVDRVRRNVDFDTLIQGGLLVTLHITRWRAASKRTLGDLGVELTDDDERSAWRDFLDPNDLGAQKLLPVDVVKDLRRLEGNGRSLLRRTAISTRWGAFVPLKRFATWRAQDDLIAQEYLAYREVFAQEYPRMRERAQDAFFEAAKGVYRRLKSLDKAAPVDLVFCAQYASRMTDQFRSQQEVVESLGWSREFSVIPSPSLLAEDAIRARELMEQYQLNAAAVQDANAIKATMMRQFFADVQGSLRSKLLEMSEDVLASIKSKGRAYSPHFAQMRQVIDAVRQLNITEDEEVNEQLNALRLVVGDVGERDISTPNLERVLRQIADSSREVLDEIEGDPRLMLRVDAVVENARVAQAPRLNGSVTGEISLPVAKTSSTKRRL